MNDAAGHQPFVVASASEIVEHFSQSKPEVNKAIAAATGAGTPGEIEEKRQALLADFTKKRDEAAAETAEAYTHYASRVDIVGVYQSILGTVFQDLPGLQGYGNRNAVWLATPLEQLAFKVKAFFHEVHDIEGAKVPFIQAVAKAWHDLKVSKAPYPLGTPETLRLDEHSTMSLLADWGGDNLAAKNVAASAAKSNPKLVVHLGDIYYGGIKLECEAFLRNWPLQGDPMNPGAFIPSGSSLALNGNHEMFSGGESYFNVVLKAFGQGQPFFCL